mgnify:CR=1 FL=1
MSEVENQEVETQEPSAVTELINQITSGDLANAEGSFKSLVQDKMSDALEAQRIATAQAIFNDQDDDVEIDETDIETTENPIPGKPSNAWRTSFWKPYPSWK